MRYKSIVRTSIYIAGKGVVHARESKLGSLAESFPYTLFVGNVIGKAFAYQGDAR